MTAVKSGVWARKRTVLSVSGLALVAGASMAGMAHAEGADAAAATEVSRVDVQGVRRPLDHDTGLSVAPASVQDTPQAISVIGAAQMKAQGVTSLEQALRNVPGITIAIGEGGTLSGDQFKIRGFDAKDDIYIDGLRDFGAYQRDSFNYEEVQVLKGPSGAMFGRGTTGGAINTISKQPKLDDFESLDGYVGDGAYYRALADVNHQLGETSAVRLSLMANNSKVVDRDLVYSRRWGAALTAGFGLGTDTSVVASYLHQDNHQRPDYGIDIVQPPGSVVALPATEYGVGIGRSSFLGFREDLDRSDADIFTVRLKHKVSDNLTFTSDTRYGRYSRFFQYTSQDQCNAACTTALFDGDPATEPQGGIGGSGPYDADAWGLQNISALRYDGPAGGLRTQAILGIDVSKQVNDKTFYVYSLPAGVTTRPALPHSIVNTNPRYPTQYTVFRAVPGQNLNCSGAGNCTTNILGPTLFTSVLGTGPMSTHGDSTDLGVFLTDRLWFSDGLSVIGSLRLDRYSASLATLTYASAYSNVKAKSTLKSPRVSAVWEPARDQTFYVSWGKSQTPQGTSIVGAGVAITVTSKDLKPEDSEIWEAGAKFHIPSTRMSFTASLFDIRKDNALQADPATGFLQAQSGERQEVKGFELGLDGKLTQAWTVNLGYSHLDARIKESYSNCTLPTTTAGAPTTIVCPVGATAVIPVRNTIAEGRQVTFVPRDSATFYTTYNMDDWVKGLQVGGDIIYSSRMFMQYAGVSSSYANRGTLVASKIAEAPHSITLDAFASYRFGPYRVGLNVYNLANRLNYTQVFSNRAIPSPGRTVIVSLGATF